MSWRRPRSGALVLLAVLAGGAVPVIRALPGPVSQQVSVETYDRAADPRVLVAQVTAHPDFLVAGTTTEETATSVVLHVSMRPPSRWSWSGGDLGVTRSVRIRLDRPLAGRQVFDGRLGTPVAER